MAAIVGAPSATSNSGDEEVEEISMEYGLTGASNSADDCVDCVLN